MKTATIYKPILLLALLLWGVVGMAETYVFTGTGDWSNPARWSPVPDATFLGGTINFEGLNIRIEGTATVPSGGLTIIRAGEIVVKTGATLDIWEGISISAPNFKIGVESGGFFVVHGDFSVATGASLNLDVNGGYLSVNGNFTQNGNISGGLNNSPHVYITGTETGDYFNCPDPSLYNLGGGGCNFGNRTAIINIESPDIRQLLLGTLPLSMSYTSTKVDCSGSTNGTLTVEGNGGAYMYQYSLDGIVWYPTSVYTSTSYTFTGLAGGGHNVFVRDNDIPPSNDVFPATVDEPGPLSLSVSQPSLCTGTIVVTASGGNPPYTIDVSGTEQTGDGPVFTFTGLTAGNKTISIADDLSCPDPGPDNFLVEIDAQNPTFTNFPPNFHMTYADYVSGASLKVDAIAETDASTFNMPHNGFHVYNVDLSNYTDPTVAFQFTVNGTPGASDFIRVLYRYDGSSSYVLLQQFPSVSASPLTVTLPLEDLPSDNSTIDIRLETEFTTSDLSYNFTNFTITADEVFSVANRIDGGSPGCDDDLSGCDTKTYTDSPPIWVCNEGTNIEFYFNRTWRIVDYCGKITTQVQRISVGTPPVFDGFETSNPDLTLGFCDDVRTIDIAAPSASDVCTPGDVSITWEIDNSEGIVTGTDDIEGFPFPVGETSTVTWTATDLAGVTNSQIQQVTVKPAMEVDFTYTPAAGSDICIIDDNVEFGLTVTGGSETYNNYVYTPAGGTPGGDAANGTPTYTTNGLTQAVDRLTVIITDSDNCSDTFDSDPFIVHDRIVTKEITRE